MRGLSQRGHPFIWLFKAAIELWTPVHRVVIGHSLETSSGLLLSRESLLSWTHLPHSAHLIDCIFASHCFSVDGRNSVKWHKSHDTSHVSKFGRQLVHGKAKRISNASKNPLTIPFSGFLLKAHTFLAEEDVKNSSPLLGPPIPCSWYFTYSPSVLLLPDFHKQCTEWCLV